MNNTYYTYERVMTHSVFKIGDVTDDVRLSSRFRVLLPISLTGVRCKDVLLAELLTSIFWIDKTRVLETRMCIQEEHLRENFKLVLTVVH